MPDRPPSTPRITASPDDAGPRRSGNRPRSKGDGPRMVGFNIVLAVVVAALVLAGWFIAAQHQALEASERELERAGERLAVLEQRLHVTDQVMSETDDAVKDQIDFWESEIRKLWDVSNKRNKTWIKDNQQAIARHASTLDGMQATLANLKSTASRHEDAIATQQAVLDRLVTLENEIGELVSAQRELTDQVNAARQTVNSLKAGLERRVTTNEEAITAIDAYRLQVNQRLADLEQRLERLTAPPVP